MRVITVTNEKGGVGKTTTAISMEAVLQERGYKTLHIDADPQCNGSDTYKAVIEDEYTLFDSLLAPLFVKKAPKVPLSQCIQHTELGDIIPGDDKMNNADVILSTMGNKSGRQMKYAIEQLKEDTDYDYVIIDTAPAENTLLYNCLIASDAVIIPTEADRYGIQSVVSISKVIRNSLEDNPDLWTAGVLLTKFNRKTNISKSIREQMKNIFAELGISVFDQVIHEGVKAKEASTLQTSLVKMAKDSVPAQDYDKFVTEYLTKEKEHYENV